jgi:hypothetical protein
MRPPRTPARPVCAVHSAFRSGRCYKMLPDDTNSTCQFGETVLSGARDRARRIAQSRNASSGCVIRSLPTNEPSAGRRGVQHVTRPTSVPRPYCLSENRRGLAAHHRLDGRTKVSFGNWCLSSFRRRTSWPPRAGTRWCKLSWSFASLCNVLQYSAPNNLALRAWIMVARVPRVRLRPGTRRG